MRRRIATILILFIFNCLSLSAVESRVVMRRVDGVPQKEINSIYEDSRGFLWIATLDGLIRYDGHTAQRFEMRHAEETLSSNMLHKITEDSGGNIWVGTYGRGICRLNQHTQKIKKYSFEELFGSQVKTYDIASMVIDRDDNLWIANVSGVMRLRLNKSTFDVEDVTIFPITKRENTMRDFVTKIHEDRSGNIWIGSNAHLKRVISTEGGELKCETFDIRSNDICDYGDIGIVSVAKEVSIFTPKGDGFERQVINKGIYTTKVTSVGEGSIWIGNRRGLSHLTQSEGGADWSVTESYEREDIPFELTTCSVSALEVTLDGQLWVGTRGGGIFTISSQYILFENHPNPMRDVVMTPTIIKSIMMSSRGDIWLGTENDGVFIQRGDQVYGDGVTNLTINDFDDRAYALVESGADGSSRNIVWVGTAYPSYLKSIDARSLQVVEQSFDTFQIGFVFALCMSSEDTLWAGTYNNGLWRLKIGRDGLISSAQHFTINNSSIASNIIRALYLDPENQLWISTDVGISRVKSEELYSDAPTFHKSLKDGGRTTLEGSYILQVERSPNGDMLFGSMDRGLLMYDSRSDSLRSISSREGLSSNAVKSFVRDGDAVWMATNNGISKYEIAQNKVVNFSSSDGIKELEFSSVCALQRKNSDILFGNKSGYVTFKPTSLPMSNELPSLFFTDLYVNYQCVEVGEDPDNSGMILSQALEFTREISLSYDQRNFAIGFVGQNYINPQSDTFQYKLEGFDREWRSVTSRDLRALYTNISEGDYTFRVRVLNKSGVVSDSELSLSIHVAAPWYRTVWAYLCYLLLFVVFVYVVFRIVRFVYRKKRELYRAQIEQHKTEEMMRYKMDFFVDVSHEFRTPLTLINIPLESLSERIGDKPEYREELSNIRHNVDKLMNLITQLLDFRKIECGRQSVKSDTIELESFVRSCVFQFEALALSRGMKLSVLTTMQEVRVDVDCELMEKVFVNILSNSFKYTPEGGEVWCEIELSEDGRSVVVSIRDTGRGISREDLSHLFERFYRAGNQGGMGSGIGLALCRSIVELMGGEIAMESEVGVGTSCVIRLPLSSNEVTWRGAAARGQEVTSITLDGEVSGVVDSAPLREAQTSASSRKLLLIVEDNVELRGQLVSILRGEYELITAADGALGLESCRLHYPDLIVTDIMMPTMNGIEMCREIKGDERISHTPILVLTADSSVRMQIDSFTIGGADGYLPKPFSLEVLRSKISTILSNREISKSHYQSSSIVSPEAIAHTQSDLKCLQRIISIINREMHNSKLSVEYIAQEYGVTRTYLNRKIKALTGETSTQFLRNIRLKYAAELIGQGKLNVTEVAWAVGYNDVDTFRQRFKELFGVSPTSYKSTR